MGIRAVGTLGLAALCTLLAGARAEAVADPFDGPGGYGISQGSAEDAEDAGLEIIPVEGLQTAASFGLTIPAPNVLTFHLVQTPTFEDPHTATSTWTVTNSGQQTVQNLWLVFLRPSPYTPSEVGIEIDDEDGWAVLAVFVGSGQSGTTYYYPAVFLGDLDPTNAVSFTMRHLVGEPLNQNSQGEFVLPQYTVGGFEGMPVPEPGVIALLASGLAGLALLRRDSV